MSHSSQPYHPNAGQAGGYMQGRRQSAAAVSRHLHRGHEGYTLVHGGRQVRIGPVAFWIVVGTLVIMGVWSIATGTYFAFSNDVLTRLIAPAVKQTARSSTCKTVKRNSFDSDGI